MGGLQILSVQHAQPGCTWAPQQLIATPTRLHAGASRDKLCEILQSIEGAEAQSNPHARR